MTALPDLRSAPLFVPQTISFATITQRAVLSLCVSAAKVYNQLTGQYGMSFGRTDIGKILLRALVLLLLCGIVVEEFPELLSLTDNATNDFTVIRINSRTSPTLVHAAGHVRKADLDSYTYAPELCFSRVSSFDKAELVPSGAFILHSVLRT